MELSRVLFVAGLAAVLASACNLVLAPLWSRAREHTSRATSGLPFAPQLATLALQICTGLALGFLFWLSWGLAALVGVSWWERGAFFAIVTWSAGCLPILTVQLVLARSPWPATAAAAVDWLIVFMSVGLASSWVWSQGP